MMIKPIFSIVFAMFLLQSPLLFSSDIFEGKVKGGFKSCILYGYMYKSGKIDLKSKSKQLELKFDNAGNVIEEVKYEFADKPGDKTTYKYNAKGYNTVQLIYDRKGKPSMKATFKYDDKGNKIEYLLFTSSGAQAIKKIYKYDNNGFLIEEVETSKYDPTPSVKKFKNDDKGNKIEEFFTSSPNSKKTFKYDGNKNLIETINWEGSKMTGRTVFKLDSFGNRFEVMALENGLSDKPVAKGEYVYFK